MRLFGLEIVNRNRLSELVQSEVKRQTTGKYSRSQMRAGEFDYSGTFANTYSNAGEIRTYKMMRNLVAFLDAAVLKRVLLLGDFEIYGEDDQTTEFLRMYKKTVRENFFGRGWINFLHQHADSVYTTGIGLSERINREDMSGALHLVNGDPEYLRFIKDIEEGYILGYQQSGMSQPKPFANPENVYYTAFDKRYGSPKGYSLFSGLEFATQLQTRIMQALHNTTWRMGDPIFLAVTKGETVESGEYDGAAPADVSNNFKAQLKEVAKARSQGQVGDMHLYMPGDYQFEVKALGVEGMPAFDFTANSRVVIEQLITKTHLPPYAFGFYQWNSNYRMSTDQQKLLVQAVESDRQKLDAVIERDFGMELMAAGLRKKFWWEWSDVDLTDMVDNARVGLMAAQARKSDADVQVNLLWMNGIINDQQLIDGLTAYGVITESTNIQKMLDSLGNIRKLALLKNITNEVMRTQTTKVLNAEN